MSVDSSNTNVKVVKDGVVDDLTTKIDLKPWSTSPVNPSIVTEESGGMKGDGGKPDWSLVEWQFFKEVVDVLTFGKNKYSARNWQKVSRERYEAAIMRHYIAYLEGENNDPETGISHLAHMGASLMFLAWFDEQEKGKLY